MFLWILIYYFVHQYFLCRYYIICTWFAVQEQIKYSWCTFGDWWRQENITVHWTVPKCFCYDKVNITQLFCFFRIICLELTNGGTLQEFLQKVELPLPEQYQRMIIHDVAEGLFYLHHENVLHNNLNSSCIYLKGSLQVSIVINYIVNITEMFESSNMTKPLINDTIQSFQAYVFMSMRVKLMLIYSQLRRLIIFKIQSLKLQYPFYHKKDWLVWLYFMTYRILIY